VLGCLAKDPDQRPPSAAALAERLSACQDAAAWTRKHAGAWWDRYAPASTGAPEGEPFAPRLGDMPTARSEVALVKRGA